MLVSFLNWIYIFATAYVIGFFLIPRLAKLIGAGDVRPNWCDNVVAGLVSATVYAEVFSLFYKVGLVANIIMLIGCAIFLFIDRKRFVRSFAARPKLPEGVVTRAGVFVLIIGAIVIFALCLMYTAESLFHYDTGLYHAQSIHWIEDYGVVKGLGLLHSRFAYNSSYFPLCALYSMRDITGGQSLHSMSGFLFALMCVYSFYGWIRAIVKRRPGSGLTYAVSSCIRVAPLLYFMASALDITSPESDYVTCNLIIWIFLRLSEIYEEETDGDKLGAYALVAVCSFSLVGYKLSAAVIPLITLWPLVILIRKKMWKSIGICALLCALTVLPYVARNVIICGWPVYPVAHFDLFNVPWKFDKQRLIGEATEIRDWAKGLNLEDAPHSTFSAWLSFWWDKQYLATQLFIRSLLMSLPFVIVLFLDRKRWFIRFLTGVLAATLVFYLFNGPLIRFCYGPVLVMPLMIVGAILDLAARRSKLALALSAMLALVVMYPAIISTKELIKYDYQESRACFSPKDHLVKQIDYPLADVKEMDWYGYKVYIPNEGDQCWYYAFPSSPYREGFALTEPNDGDIRNGIMIK